MFVLVRGCRSVVAGHRLQILSSLLNNESRHFAMLLSPVQVIVEEPTPQESRPPAAVIRLTIPRAEIQTAMGPAIQEIIATLKEQQIDMVGPLFCHHLTCSEDTFDFEVGFPTATTLPPSPPPVVRAAAAKEEEEEDAKTTSSANHQHRVYASMTPSAMKVAKATYTGPYEGLHAAWSEFGDRLKLEGCHRIPGDETLWEIYTVGPETTDDSTQYQTELYLPIA
jgi:effector-binding domain-containing protein